MKTKVFSASSLEAAQERFGFRFPPDVFDVLRTRPVPGGYDWETDGEHIRTMLSRPLEGLLFDVEMNGLWWPEWGKRPFWRTSRRAVVTKIIQAAPTLIPLYGHRYIPEVPNEAGNPIFSVMQSDIIIYGNNLTDWLHHEFKIGVPQLKPEREIEFWSEAVRRFSDHAYYPYRKNG